MRKNSTRIRASSALVLALVSTLVLSCNGRPDSGPDLSAIVDDIDFPELAPPEPGPESETCGLSLERTGPTYLAVPREALVLEREGGPKFSLVATVDTAGLDVPDMPVAIFEVLDTRGCEVVRRLEVPLHPTARPEVRRAIGVLEPTTPGGRALRAGDHLVGLTTNVPGGGAVAQSIVTVGQQQRIVCNGPPLLEAEREYGPTGGREEFDLDGEGPLDLCIELVVTGDEQSLSELTVNGQAVLGPARLGRDGFEIPKRKRFAVEYPSPGSEHRFAVAVLRGGFELKVYGKARRAERGVPHDEIPCRGDLWGFLDNPISDTRRRIRRHVVLTRCTAIYRTKHKFAVDFGSGYVRRKPVERHAWAATITNTDGVFETSIGSAEWGRAGVGKNDKLIWIGTDCERDRQCGVDRRGRFIDSGTYDPNLPIVNVPDLAVAGFVARLVTDDPNPTRKWKGYQALFSRFGVAASKPNDLPVLLHEPFDPLLENGTEWLRWAINGQPIDMREEDGEDILTDSCEDPIRGPCFPCTPALGELCEEPDSVCQRQGCAGGDAFQCNGADVLTPLRRAGYDVWLVDRASPDSSVREMAQVAPRLYQEVLDFPDPDRPDPEASPWERVFRFDRPRRLAVGGLSLGGVVARIALRLWERKDSLPPNAPLRAQGGDYLEPGPDRVALYVSFDAPHLGATLPLGFQAIIKDKNLRTRANFGALMNAEAAHEMLLEDVPFGVETGCFKSDGSPKDCSIGRDSFSGPIPPNAIFEALRADSMEGLGSADGLPESIPRVAVANGSRSVLPSGEQDRVFRVDVRKGVDLGPLEIPFVDAPDVIDDPQVIARDGPQERGSGLPTFCRVGDLKKLSKKERKYLIFAGEVKSARLCMREGPVTDAKVCLPDGAQNPPAGAVFPSFIPTASALLIRSGEPEDPFGEIGRRWDDALWGVAENNGVEVERNLSHYAVNDRHCRFLLYHLDGHMKGDRDGYPPCESTEDACADGGRKPGLLIDDFPLPVGPRWLCDPDDRDPSVLPLFTRLKIELPELGRVNPR